jgi:cytochrome c oxidase subunit 2
VKAIRIVASCVPALLLASCSGLQSALDVHGSAARELKWLMLTIIAVCTLVWIAVMIVLVLALWRRRRETGSPRGERGATWIISGAVMLTVLIISGFTLASFFTTRAMTLPSDNELLVRVRGIQWWWELVYPDPDETRVFKTANELRIPVGRTVRLQLEGVDVIHSFWVPSLAGKVDLIPGRLNELTLRADRPGVYRGQCAEFCGLQHAHMSLFVIAEEPEAYEAWAQRQRANALEPADDEVRRGREAFLTKPCGTCHTVRGTAASGSTGPDLTHVGGRRSIAAGTLDTTRGSLAAWIADPQTIKPGNNMPLVPMSAEELRAISAYMASLK